MIDCFPPFYLALFLEIPHFFHLGPVSSFCLFLCICLYVLDRSVMTPSLPGVALSSRCLAGYSSVISLISTPRELFWIIHGATYSIKRRVLEEGQPKPQSGNANSTHPLLWPLGLFHALLGLPEHS